MLDLLFVRQDFLKAWQVLFSTASAIQRGSISVIRLLEPNDQRLMSLCAMR